VIVAGDGKEGFEKAKFWHPDLITLDISMPEESGVRLLRNLQKDPDTANMPIVIVTGISHEFKRFIETRKQVRPLAGYFDKPIDREQFLAKINEILSARAV
jgi:CheY-like chemotaxis protein